MLIKSIELTNFRQYKHAVLTFSSDKDKPFTIILGENGYGKTTFVRAFLWCLYQDNQFTDKALLNSDVLNEISPNASAKVSVKMTIEHNDKTYNIITSEEYKKSVDFKAVSTGKPITRAIYMSDTGAKPMSDIDSRNMIDEMLSPQLKDYFFFDGETNKIDNVSSKKNLTEAVSDIMGLKRIELIQKYFDSNSSESVTSKLRNQLKTDDPTEGEVLKDSLQKKSEELSKYKEELENNKNQISILEQKIAEEEAIIEANRDVQEDQERKIALERKLNNNKRELELDLQKMLKSIGGSNGLLKILLTDSYYKFDLKKLIKSSSFSGKDSWAHISEEVIDQILKRGECLCGQKITNNDEAITHLKSQKEHMEPHDFGKYASDFCDDEDQSFQYSSSAYDSISETTSKYLNLLEDYDKDRAEYDGLKRKIANKEDVGIHQKNVNDYRSQISFLEGKNDNIENDTLRRLSNEIESCQTKLDLLSSKNAANKETSKLLRYALSVEGWANKKIKENKERIRFDLEKKVSAIFTSIYTGKRTIKIDDKFYATTVVTDGLSNERFLDRSTGTETVKNFSFVCGLMDLVKEHLLVTETDDSPDIDDNTDSAYPFVVDAPFSNTDEKHIQNICNKLPIFCNQIIMFVMSSHYHMAKSAIGDRVGEIYHIERYSETYDEVKEGER